MDTETGGANIGSDELQIALVAAGVILIVLIFLYNKWQERRHRKRAEKAFRSNHPDVLLDLGAGGDPAIRREPLLNSEGKRECSPDDDGTLANDEPRLGAGRPAARGFMQALPAALDSRIDCIIRITAVNAIEAARLWAVQSKLLDGLSRPFYWYAFDDSENVWRSIDAHSSGAHHGFLAALQLVDRQGPIGEADFLRFTGGVQRLAEQFHAVPEGIPQRAEVLSVATELDRFCEGVDKLIAINIVANGAGFPGPEIEAMARAEGLQFGNDGNFHALDGEGRTLYILNNCEPSSFIAEDMATLQTRAVALMFEVPRVADGGAVFELMMRFAARFAETLGGTVVDDDGHPFGTEALGVIRAHIQQFQTTMANAGIPAGSPVALRLFDA